MGMVRISSRQLISLLILIRMTPQTLNCTTLNVVRIPSIGLVADVIGTALAVPLVYLVARAGTGRPGETLVGRVRRTLGKPLGVIAGVWLTSYLLVVPLLILGSVGTSFSTAIMPETPMVVFVLVLAFLASNAARKGLEVVGRLSEVLAPVVVSALLLIAVFSINRMDFGHLRPIFLPGGYHDLVAPVGGVFSYFTTFIVIATLLPHLESPKSGILSSLTAVLITGVLVVIMCVAVISTFGPTTDAIVLHAFALARTASLGAFFERFEVMMMAVWTIGAVTTAAVFIWAASEELGELLSLRAKTVMVYPLGLIVSLFSLTSLNTTLRLISFAKGPWAIYSAATAVLMAGLGLLATLADRRKEPRSK